MPTTSQSAVRVDKNVRRRLKVYAAAADMPAEKLAEKILVEWLESQKPVGDSCHFIPLSCWASS